MPMLFRAFVLILGLMPTAVVAAEMTLTIRTDFPGGNVRIDKNEGNTVHLAPDLRGGPAWFYWHFEAEASHPGRATFVFAKAPLVGVRGPAISRDAGKTWQWLGTEQVEYASAAKSDKGTVKQDRFHVTFTEAGQKLRFAVAIPYLQSDLDNFLAKNAGHPLLTRGILTETRAGRRPVELLQIGQPGPGVQAVLLTARHHACESMASYVLEGFLQEALADSPAAIAFRKKYVLFAVPIVDKDGVQAGDQGKNRLPHDHNRDYGPMPIYPEIQAIQELANKQQIHLSLDIHCPFLLGDIHEAFYFDGLALPHVQNNVNELISWLREERPQSVMAPINLLKKPAPPVPGKGLPNSHYFARRADSLFAATLEVPYTQRSPALDEALARQYGAGLLRAWVRTEFVAAGAKDGRGPAAHEGLLAFRNKLRLLTRSNPKAAEQLVATALEAATTPAIEKAECRLQLAHLRLQQRRYSEALELSEVVAKDANASAFQQAVAAVQTISIATSDPKSTTPIVEARLAEVLRYPNPSREHQEQVFAIMADYYFQKQDYERALVYAREQQAVVPLRGQGKNLNRMAAIHDLLKQGERAVTCRKDAVKVLKPLLDPVPVGQFGAVMAGDLFEALQGIPGTPIDEKKRAAALVLNHKAAPAVLREKVQKALAEIERR